MPKRMPSTLSDGLLPQACLDDSAQAGVDDAGGTAALADDGIAVKHDFDSRISSLSRLGEVQRFSTRHSSITASPAVQASKLAKKRAYQLPTSMNPRPPPLRHDALVAPIDQSADPVRRHVGGQRRGAAAAMLADDQQRRLPRRGRIEILAARCTANCTASARLGRRALPPGH